MTPLERLFRGEHGVSPKTRMEASTARADAASGSHEFCIAAPVSEELIRAAAGATARDVETMRERLTLAGDVRDVLSARDSVKNRGNWFARL